MLRREAHSTTRSAVFTVFKTGPQKIKKRHARNLLEENLKPEGTKLHVRTSQLQVCRSRHALWLCTLTLILLTWRIG